MPRYINLGSGDLPIKDCVGVDIQKTPFADILVDLSVTPWPWKSDSIDGIYMLHSLEHLENTNAALVECHRILKKGGFLFIQVPHSSLVTGIGIIPHFRTFSYNAFVEHLSDRFDTKINEIRWLGYPRNKRHPYIDFAVQKKTGRLYFLSYIVQPLINLNPSVFERFWCYWVGGADEVVWKGIKK